ncbi:hypothetical protein FHS39_002101 [Streptomyces olivoverticillatus]|uniref:Uncharacterized protein n=1 Tax=Streptomyces olivoverticillatus TaxID=66427 RepID=A0A7W7PLR4_9ACTN|nr:hypothetical protein [Streptomyces olivoverticillatus]MBB4893090.1 hypothetical protein [Streptomyces olivoverticillatus]
MSAVRQAPAARATQTRLPWWAVTLAAAGFAVLFCLLGSPASADTPAAGGTGSLARVLQLVEHSFVHRAP